MSYPQKDADLYAGTNGQQFFRLNTTLLSDGDIYESSQGAHGLAIGPDSDIAKVTVGYYDDQVDRFLNQVAISPRRPFAGNIAARNADEYAPSGMKGRILLWPDELFNVTWRPGGFNPAIHRIDFEMPVMDVVEYFSPLGLHGQRNDKQYHYDQIVPPDPLAGGTWNLILPFYGRRYAHILFANEHATDDVAIGVDGLTFRQVGTANSSASDTVILASTAVAAGAQRTQLVKASVNGMFDALFIQMIVAVAGPYPALLRITTSDTEV